MNPRELDPALDEEVKAPVLRPFLAVHIDFPDPVFAFTGKGVIRFNRNGTPATSESQEWLGIEGIASIDAIKEGTAGSAAGVSATLFRVPSEFRDDIADQAVRGCLYEIFVGAFDTDFQTVRGIKCIWKGTLQSYRIVDSGDTITVTAGGESRAIDQRRPAIKRFTDEYQQRKFAGDRCFEYVPNLVEIPILWAGANQDGL